MSDTLWTLWKLCLIICNLICENSNLKSGKFTTWKTVKLLKLKLYFQESPLFSLPILTLYNSNISMKSAKHKKISHYAWPSRSNTNSKSCYTSDHDWWIFNDVAQSDDMSQSKWINHDHLKVQFWKDIGEFVFSLENIYEVENASTNCKVIDDFNKT